MNQIQNKFDKLIKSKGGIFLLDQFPKDDLTGKGLVESKLDSFRYFLDLDLFKKDLNENNEIFYLDIVRNSSINAYAFRDDKDAINFIGINYGLILRLFDYFEILLSASDILPHIGDSQKEVLTSVDIKDDLAITLDKFKPKHHSPICPIRREFASYLWIFCTDFIFHHEVGHHIFGHVKYLKDSFNIQSIDEFNFFENNNTLIDNSILQALELDADDLGCYLTTFKFLNAYKTEKGFQKYSDDPVKILIIILGLIFHIFDELRFNKALDKSQTHPHPTVRILYVLGNLTQYYSQSKGEKIDTSIYTNEIEGLENIFGKISKYTFTQKYKSLQVFNEMLRLTEILKLLKNEVLMKFTANIHFEMPRLF